MVGRCGEHEIEQAASVGMLTPVRFDHAIDNGIDAPASAHECRQPRRAHVYQPLCRRKHDQEVVQSHDAVDGIGQFIDFIAQIGRK